MDRNNPLCTEMYIVTKIIFMHRDVKLAGLIYPPVAASIIIRIAVNKAKTKIATENTVRFGQRLSNGAMSTESTH